MHLQVFKKISTINEFVKNKKYVQALHLHEELCSTYPHIYAKDYGVKIAKVCFECCQFDKSFFKKGVYFLQGQTLNETQFSTLYQIIPSQLKGKYTALFDVLYREKNKVKEYKFTLNNDEVRLLS